MYLKEIVCGGAVMVSIALILKGQYDLSLTPVMAIIGYVLGNKLGQREGVKNVKKRKN